MIEDIRFKTPTTKKEYIELLDLAIYMGKMLSTKWESLFRGEQDGC